MKPGDETNRTGSGFREPKQDDAKPAFGIQVVCRNKLVPVLSIGNACERLMRGSASKMQRPPGMVVRVKDGLCQGDDPTQAFIEFPLVLVHAAYNPNDRCYKLYSMLIHYEKYSK